MTADAEAVVHTPRLDLVALDRDTLRLVARDEACGLRQRLGAEVPRDWCACVPATLLLAQLADDPRRAAWWTRAIVHRDGDRVVGVAGFHGPPDDDGRVEVGYEVVSAHRGRGFAREAVVTLLDWAARRGARTCVASIAVDNAASRSLAASLGFVRTGPSADGGHLFLRGLAGDGRADLS